MLKSYLTSIVLFICSTQLAAQAPAIQWQKCYGGSADDQVYMIQKSKTAGRNNLEMNTNSKGIYIVQLIIGGERIQKKIMTN